MSGYDVDKADEYSKNRDEYSYTNKDLFNLVHDIGIQNKNVLDFGCGDGILSFNLAEGGAKSVTGIDASEEMIKLAQKKLSEVKTNNIKFQVADGNNLPFAENIFDVVLANYVLIVFDSLHSPLKEIHRVLKPGGFLIATVNNADIDDEQLSQQLIPLSLGESNVIVKDYLRSDNETKKALADTNFSIKVFENIENSYAKIEPTFPKKDLIKNFHFILFSAQK